MDEGEKYKFFLITRFNIIQNWFVTANRNDSDIQSDAWLDEIKTVLCDHTDVSKFALYVELPYVEPMWVELIHSRNTANRMATDKLIHVDGSLYVGKDVDSYRTPYIIYCIWLIIGKARYILKYIRRKIEKHIFRRK